MLNQLKLDATERKKHNHQTKVLNAHTSIWAMGMVIVSDEFMSEECCLVERMMIKFRG